MMTTLNSEGARRASAVRPGLSPYTRRPEVTDTTKYEGAEASSTMQLDIRDDATEAQRQNAQRSVEALVARAMEATDPPSIPRRRTHQSWRMR
jgi:hypothetical protein